MLRKYKLPKWIRLLLGLLLLLLILGILLGADIYTYSFATDAGAADAAIVLGAGVWKSEPSPVYKERINHAIDLYKAGRVKYLILTGGTVGGQPVAEAIAARDYTIRNGVMTTDILYETLSTDTFENFCNSRDIVEREHFGRILVVSDPLHMRRAMTIARDLGIDAYPSPTTTARYVGWESETAYLMREVAFYAWYLLQRPFRIPEQRCPPARATSVAATQSQVGPAKTAGSSDLRRLALSRRSACPERSRRVGIAFCCRDFRPLTRQVDKLRIRSYIESQMSQ